MSDTRADAWNHLLWLILIVTSLSVAPLDRWNILVFDKNIECVLVYFSTSVATLTHFHYGYSVVSLSRNYFILLLILTNFHLMKLGP